jgi:hypothetical protein
MRNLRGHPREALGHLFSCGTKPCHRRQRLGSRAPTPLLLTAANEPLQIQPRAQPERPGSFRSTDFMGRERKPPKARMLDANRYLAQGLHSIAENPATALMSYGTKARQVLNGAHFVLSP